MGIPKVRTPQAVGRVELMYATCLACLPRTLACCLTGTAASGPTPLPGTRALNWLCLGQRPCLPRMHVPCLGLGKSTRWPEHPGLHQYLTQPPPVGPPGDSRAAAALIPAHPRSCLIYRKARPAMTQVPGPDVWDFAERSVCTPAFTQPLPRAVTVLSGLGTNFQCCPCLAGHHHPAGRHLCHHRRGLARGAGPLFAADSCDPVGTGPPTPFKLTSAEALGHPRLYIKPNKPQVRP